MLLELLLRLLVLRPVISSIVAIAMSCPRDGVVIGSVSYALSTKSSSPAQQLVLPISAFAQRIDRHSRQLGVYRIPV